MDGEDLLWILGLGGMFFLGNLDGQRKARNQFDQDQKDRELIALREEIEKLKRAQLPHKEQS